MKKQAIAFAFILSALFLLSCANVVVRWPNRSEERQNRSLELTRRDNIFHDYLWATPPLYGRKLDVQSGKAAFAFGDRNMELAVREDGDVVLTINGRPMRGEFQTSARSCYYNLDLLKTIMVPRERYVSKTEWVTERVQVRKTRWVTKRVAVRKSRTHYDSVRKSTWTEWYTDWENQTTTEWYDDWENRRVLKTVWQWETVRVPVIDIPAYDTYRFKTEAGDSFLVYKVSENGKDAFYFQNVSYLSALEMSDGNRTFEKPILILFIDANANGNYFDDEDLLMYNSWNPYERGSAYQEVGYFKDNFWYRLGYLKNENFTTFSADAAYGRLDVKNANSDFVGIEKKGTLTISGLTEGMRVVINGHRYGPIKDGAFTSEIEYGYFNLRVTNPGHLDFRKTFSVGVDGSEVVIPYEPTAAAGSFRLTNHGFRNWKIVLDDGKTPVTYYNEDVIAVPSGAYKVIVSDGTTNFGVDVKIEAGEVWKYNFSDDKLEKGTAADLEEGDDAGDAALEEGDDAGDE